MPVYRRSPKKKCGAMFSPVGKLVVATSFLLLLSGTACAPTGAADLEKVLDDILDAYLEKNVKNGDVYDTMQGDQPPVEAVGNSTGTNATAVDDVHLLQASRNRISVLVDENRTRGHWIEMLKQTILQQVGRSNSTTTETKYSPLNLTQFFPKSNGTTGSIEDLISKKIRTFYPTCLIPEAAEIEFRNEDKLMNLYFNYTDEDESSKIATATLRLHRIPSENVTSIGGYKSKNCTTAVGEEEKLLRISIFWYMKPQRNKRRGKKRLCDSRVMSETDSWVELNVANAVKSWSKEQNLGLAVQVEDQDGRTLKADKYFKGPTCLVGMSNHRATTGGSIVDNARTPEQLIRLLGRNSTATFSSSLLLLPTIDVCSLGVPLNLTDHLDQTAERTNACNLRLLRDQAQRLVEKDKLERLATLASKLRSPPSPSTNHRHLRHQKNYIEEKLADSDSRILMTKEQVFELLRSLNLTNST